MLGICGVLAVLVIIPCPLVFSIPIDNGVEGEPTVVCYADRIQVDFRTRNAFEGHVYVKGHYAEPGCRSDAGQGRARQATITVPFNKCGVQRTRSLNPKGVSVKTTVVVTFHSMFLTKVDRAYSVQCFYLESERTVSVELEVSELTTGAVTQQAPVPVCRYDVLENGPEGQPVRYGIIGQQVYHKWTCSSEAQDLYCMTIHNCVVQNGAGNQAQLIDENGCSVDKYLLQNLEYTGDLSAGQEAHVFKFADQPALYFQCQITINVKDPGQVCPRPQCALAVSGTSRTVSPGPVTVYPATPVPTVLPTTVPTGLPLAFLSPPPPYPPTTIGPPSPTPSPPSPTSPPSALARRAAAVASAFFINHQSRIRDVPENGRGDEPWSDRLRMRRLSEDAGGMFELGVVDVNAQPITALDVDDNWTHDGQSQSAKTNRRTQICLNSITFGLIFSVAMAAALSSGTAIILLCKRRK